MQIYIAASLERNDYARALAEMLEADGHQVYLFSRAADFKALGVGEKGAPGWRPESPEAAQVCRTNLEQAVAADLVVYAGGGSDAWAEVGAAVGAGVPVWGIMYKLEAIGINRHMVDDWFFGSQELREALAKSQSEPEVASGE